MLSDKVGALLRKHPVFSGVTHIWNGAPAQLIEADRTVLTPMKLSAR
jgi:hypothetical protein